MSRFSMFPKSRRMTCRQVGEVLQAYLDSEVDDLTTRRIAHHLEDCRRCGMELAVYQEIKATLARQGVAVDGDALVRLRSFGARLAGEAEPGGEAHEDCPSG